MEYYLAMKKKINLFSSKEMELEIMLSELSQAQRIKVTCFPSYVEALLTE
jgi:hypothetical protein